MVASSETSTNYSIITGSATDSLESTIASADGFTSKKARSDRKRARSTSGKQHDSSSKRHMGNLCTPRKDRPAPAVIDPSFPPQQQQQQQQHSNSESVEVTTMPPLDLPKSSAEQQSDDDHPSEHEDEDPHREAKQAASRLKHQARRRLSLSHVDPIAHEAEPKDSGLLISARGLPDKDTGSRPKFQELLNSRTRVDGSGWCIAIEGAASEKVQGNFENKLEKFRGNLSDETGGLPGDLGIGHACRKGLKPESPNQDDFFILNLESYGLYAVFDGHGPYGHDVSNFVQTRMASYLWDHPKFETDIQRALQEVFRQVQSDIRAATDSKKFDASMSGCTASILVHDLKKNRIVSAHLGDSRAVLATREGDGKLKATDLTQDHKPTLEAEKARIEATGGVVKRLPGDIPHRVFLKDQMYPGLAMSRAFGDLLASQAGVIAEPEIHEHAVNPQNDEIVILCSDGVWEFITSQEAAEIVGMYTEEEPQRAADALAREAWNRWIAEEGDVVDDITVEVIHLYPKKGRRRSTTSIATV